MIRSKQTGDMMPKWTDRTTGYALQGTWERETSSSQAPLAGAAAEDPLAAALHWACFTWWSATFLRQRLENHEALTGSRPSGVVATPCHANAAMPMPMPCRSSRKPGACGDNKTPFFLNKRHGLKQRTSSGYRGAAARQGSIHVAPCVHEASLTSH
jgi:hypothetical protein